jgi:hypothetical protein
MRDWTVAMLRASIEVRDRPAAARSGGIARRATMAGDVSDEMEEG